MNSWTSVEHAWGQAALGAMIPAAGEAPSCAETDLSEFWVMFETTAPALLRWGFRLSVWAWVLVTVWLARRRFAHTSPSSRDASIVRMNQGPYAARQLAVTIKVVATLAYFSSPSVRQRFEGA